jgi:hypothetical protein
VKNKEGQKEIRCRPFSKKKKNGAGRKEQAWISCPFLTRGRKLISLNKQKLRVPTLMNRLALAKRKAKILQTAATAEGLERSPDPKG